MSWLHRPDVHGGEVSAGIVSGLVAPTAPDEGRWETLWHYMQSGPGVFKGDLQPLMANLLYIKDVVAAPRREARQ